MTTIFDKPLTGYRLVDTRIGDTLQQIAYRELGDATQWPLLISYNNLIYPFITDDPTIAGPGILQTGDQILVPAPVPAVEADVDPAAVFLIDIALDANGQLQGDSNGDFATVSGLDNLDQALSNRVDTDCGELIFHREYGSFVRQLLGVVNGPNAALLAAKYVESAVGVDSRVQSVDFAVVTTTGDTTVVQVQVTPIVGRPLKVTTTL